MIKGYSMLLVMDLINIMGLIQVITHLKNI